MCVNVYVYIYIRKKIRTDMTSTVLVLQVESRTEDRLGIIHKDLTYDPLCKLMVVDSDRDFSG